MDFRSRRVRAVTRLGAIWAVVAVFALLVQRAGGQTVPGAPTLRIVEPPAGAVYALGATIVLQATAGDESGADLGAAIAWDSDVDGALGTGATLQTVLSVGLHTVRASVTDASGRTSSEQVALGVVIPAEDGDTPPLVTIAAPAPTGTIAAGPPVTFTGTATDFEDGLLSDALVWTSDRDGALGTGATFARPLSQGIHRITARVTDAGGASGSATVVVQVGPPVTMTFAAIADTAVDAAQPATAFGTAATLRVDANTARQAFLRFDVHGVGERAVTHAVLRLQVDAGEGAGSESGGSVHVLGGAAWDEETVSWTTRPAVTGARLARAGRVVRGEVVDFDVTAAIARDGTYDLALVTDSDDEVTYRSKDGGPAPRLILTLSGNPPFVTIAEPAPATVVRLGDAVALRAHAVDLEDGDLDAHLEWISSRDGLLGVGPEVVAAALSVGTHTLSATAMDGEGAVGSAEVQLIVLPATGSGPPPTVEPTNGTPALTITAPATGDTVLMHHPVVLNALAVDPEDGDVSAGIRWVSSRDGVLGNGATLVVPELSPGTHIVTATVADSAGAPTAASITVVVVADMLAASAVADTYVDAGSPTTAFGGAPTLIAGITPASRQAFLRFTVRGVGRFSVERAVLRLTAAATSPSGGTLIPTSNVDWTEAGTTYASRPTIDGRALRSQGAVTAGQTVEFDVTRTIAGDGDYGFALVNTAGDGVRYRSREADGGGPELLLTLGRSSAPVVTIRRPAANATLDGGAPVTLAATAVDDGGNDASAAVRWSSSVDGPLGAGATVIVSRLSPGTHLLTAAVTDAHGMQGEARLAVLVKRPNLAPTVTILAPAAGVEVRPGIPVRLAAAVTDDTDRDIANRLTWTSDRAGLLGIGPSLSANLTFGRHTITAQVTDAGGRSTSAQVTMTVSVPPVVAIVTPADGTSVLPGAVVSLSGAAFDEDEGDLSRTIVWSSDVDGALGAGMVVRSSTLHAGRHTITAAVTDRVGLRTTASRALIVNTPPVVAITAPVAYWRFVPGESVTLRATAIDSEDGDIGSRVVWSSDLDGPLGTGATISVPSLRAGTHVITAAVGDATGAIAHTTLSLATFGCLAQDGPLVPLAGTINSGYLNYALQLASRLDARTGTFIASPSNRYPLNLGGADGVCVGGGGVLGLYDRTLGWQTMHDDNNAAIAFDNARLTVESVRIDNVTDGVRPQAGDGFTVRGTRMSYVRDDCVENDHVLAGTVDDSLLDGCYVAFSARPSQAIIDGGADGRGKLWTIKSTLVRLQPMPAPNGNSNADGLGHGGFFKWHLWNTPTESLSPKLALHDNVFMAERVGEVGGDRMGIPPGQLQSCSNNVMVWLGAGPFPGTLPSCFTVTTDRGVWDRAVADWERRHPQVAR